MRHAWRLALWIAVVSLVGAQGATAAPGDLDPSFGNAGTLLVNRVGGNTSSCCRVAPYPGGKTLVLTRLASSPTVSVERLNADGSLDRTFDAAGSTPGVASVALGGVVVNPAANGAVAADSAGRVVVEETVASGGGAPEVAIARLTAAGGPDVTFSNTSGTVQSTLGFSDAAANGMTVLSDDSIVIGAVVTDAGTQKVEAARFTNNGTLDGSFGTPFALNGVASPPVLSPDGHGRWLLAGFLQATGGIQNRDLQYVARLDASGRLDPTFAATGTPAGVVTDALGSSATPFAIAAATDGRPVVASVRFPGGSAQPVVERYTLAGASDSTFGSNGVASFGGLTGTFLTLTRAGDGSWLIGGTQSASFLVAHFSADGQPDSGFSPTGYVTTPIPGSISSAVDGLEIDGGGRILAIGDAGDNSSVNVAMARYQGSSALTGGGGGGPPPNANFTVTPGTRTILIAPGSAARYRWTFGDGSGTTCGGGEPIAGHVFTRRGTFTIGLTVTNAAGASANDTERVAVSHIVPHADPTNATCGHETVGQSVCTTQVRWELIDAVGLDGGCFREVTPRPRPGAICHICFGATDGGAFVVPPWFADATRALAAKMFSYAGRVEINGLIYTPHVANSGGLAIGGTIDVSELTDGIYSASADVDLPSSRGSLALARDWRVSVQLPRSAPPVATLLPPTGPPRYPANPCDSAAVQSLPQIAQLPMLGSSVQIARVSAARGSPPPRLGGFEVNGPMSLKAVDGTTIVCAPLRPPQAIPCPGATRATANATLAATNDGGLDPRRIYASLPCATVDQMGLQMNLDYDDADGHFVGYGTVDNALPGLTLPAIVRFAPDGTFAQLDSHPTSLVRLGPLAFSTIDLTVTPSGTTGNLVLQTPVIPKMGAPALHVEGDIESPNRSGGDPNFIVESRTANNFLGPYRLPSQANTFYPTVKLTVYPRSNPVAITGLVRWDALMIHEVWGHVAPSDTFSYYQDFYGDKEQLAFAIWDGIHFDAEGEPSDATLVRTRSDYFGNLPWTIGTIVLSDRGVGACSHPTDQFPVPQGLVVTWPLPPWSPTTNEKEPGVYPCSELDLVRSHQASAARAAAALEIRVPRALAEAAFQIASPSPHPAVTLLGPRGRRIDTADGHIAENIGPGGIDVLLHRPTAGLWRVVPDAGVVVSSLHLLIPGPRAAIHGSLRLAGTRRVITYDVGGPPATRVELVERGRGVDRLLRTVGPGRGRLAFTPALGPAGSRTVVALVKVFGMTVHTQVIARFRAARVRAAASPRRVLLRRRGASALVITWPQARGAVRYVVSVTLTDGRQLYRVMRGRTLVIRGAPRRIGAVARVTGLGPGGASRHAARAQIKAIRTRRNYP